jgi:hypothetical protein
MSLQCFFKLGVITYFHMNREYIAEVLCINKEEPITMCYGQCFLDKNLDLADDANSDDSTLPIGKLKIDFPVFIISESFYSFQKLLKSEQANSYYRAASSSAHHPAPFHPPAHLS